MLILTDVAILPIVSPLFLSSVLNAFDFYLTTLSFWFYRSLSFYQVFAFIQINAKNTPSSVLN